MSLRDELVGIALAWQTAYGNAPAITSALSEYDAAMLVGCPEAEYKKQMRERSVVARGHDFIHEGKRYQVKANRPSGRPRSVVTLVGSPRSMEWDCFIWMLYLEDFRLVEAWLWTRDEYQNALAMLPRLRPKHLRAGRKIFG